MSAVGRPRRCRHHRKTGRTISHQFTPLAQGAAGAARRRTTRQPPIASSHHRVHTTAQNDATVKTHPGTPARARRAKGVLPAHCHKPAVPIVFIVHPTDLGQTRVLADGFRRLPHHVCEASARQLMSNRSCSPTAQHTCVRRRNLLTSGWRSLCASFDRPVSAFRGRGSVCAAREVNANTAHRRLPAARCWPATPIPLKNSTEIAQTLLRLGSRASPGVAAFCCTELGCAAL